MSEYCKTDNYSMWHMNDRKVAAHVEITRTLY